MKETITVPADGTYIDELDRRLKHANITYTEIAGEMQPPRTVHQFSRWMRKVVEPRLSNVVEIETALFRIRRARRKSA